jgi:type VI secretion system protein ImpA
MIDNAPSLMDELLQALSAQAPCGVSLRYDSLFTDIRLAREEDDPHLPMRQWERPLKKADWGYIESACLDALRHQSKDLQLMAWLTEAWMRMHGIKGLETGLALFHGMLTKFWDHLHPQIMDGDDEPRKSPFEWLSESLSVSLRVHVVLLAVFNRTPSKISLAEWDKLTALEVDAQDPLRLKDKSENSETEFEPIYRTELISIAQSGPFNELLLQQLDATQNAIKILNQIKTFLDEKLNAEAPNLSKLFHTLVHVEKVLETLTERIRFSAKAEPAANQALNPDDGLERERVNEMKDEDVSEDTPVVSVNGPWRSREEAYATLEAVAAYLQKREPHSPTPYLIKKAVRWGKLPLPELMQEIMREEGDLNRMSNLFGQTEQ